MKDVLIPLFSTFMGAFLAFRYQYLIEKRKDKRLVAQSLMIYRNVGADELDWIKAMNAIELVFHNNERVRQSFSEYLECVNDAQKFNNGDHVRVYYEMLYLICQDCGYTQITESDIMKNIYTPKGLAAHYPNKSFGFQSDLLPTDEEMAGLFEEILHYGLA